MTTTGHSRVLKNRRFEDYRSMKQHYSDRTITEFIISGRQTTTAAAAELDFAVGDTINYIAAQGQCYIRTEADDANQHSKYVYIEYCNAAGTIASYTADLHATDGTTEVIVTGASDFYRLRQMYSEVVSATGGGKAIILTDANMGGADDVFGFIDDDDSVASISRYFAPSAATCKSYLGRIQCQVPYMLEADATPGGFFLTVTYTPVVLNLGEAQVAAPMTQVLSFNEALDWQPCIELNPASDVLIKIHKLVDADHVAMYVCAHFLEVAPTNSTPSS